MIEILNYYNEVLGKNHINPASYFEWNTFRVLDLLGEYETIAPNFKLDKDRKPTGCAKPGIEDITVHYPRLTLLIECSLQSGSKQVDCEGNSVYRHYMDRNKSTDSPCLVLFISPTVHDDLYHYYSIRSVAKIVPLSLEQFKKIVLHSNDTGIEENLLTLLHTLSYDNNFNAWDEWKIGIETYINNL